MRGVRAGLVVAVAAVVVGTAAGCGGSSGHPLVVDGTAPATAYSGPLRVAAAQPVGGDSGGDTPAAAKAQGGAAARALECDGDVWSGGGAEPWSKGDGGGSPEQGLKAYFDIEQPDVPHYGYRVERAEPDRVLYSFDVGGRTKIAVVVAKDQPGRPGWGPESSAACDPAELPASFADTLPYEFWTGPDGRRLPVTTVNSSAGAAHCDWQQAHFLELGGAGGARTLYARDPEGVLPASMLTSRYYPDAALPAGARDTGYRRDGWSLWLTADRSTAYVRTSHGVEAWPAVRKGLGCA